MRLRTHLLLAVSLALVACGGSSTNETTSNAGNGNGDTGGGETTAHPTEDATNIPPLPSDISGPPTPWASMTPEQKGHYMAEHVVPTMQPLFQAYDAQRYADFGCPTCHGANAREEHFHMPTASLPVLPTPMSPEWNALTTDHPRIFAFMAQDVEHGVAASLGVPPYDPATNQGFGCFNCHTMRGAPTTAAGTN